MVLITEFIDHMEHFSKYLRDLKFYFFLKVHILELFSYSC